MEIKISDSTSSPIVDVVLNKGESFKMETGSMVYKNKNVDLVGKTNGGFLAALGKSVLGGENFFTTEAIGLEDGGKLGIAARGLGRTKKLDISTTQWYLNDGAFLGAEGSVDYTVASQKGLGNALFGRTGGFFLLKTTGSGQLLVSSFGDMLEIELDGTEELQIDNGHIVAWEESLSYRLERASGHIGFKTGEGLVNTFSGTGKILVQTRHIQGFVDLLIPFLPQQRVNN